VSDHFKEPEQTYIEGWDAGSRVASEAANGAIALLRDDNAKLRAALEAWERTDHSPDPCRYDKARRLTAKALEGK
jgi:hypothetical protein